MTAFKLTFLLCDAIGCGTEFDGAEPTEAAVRLDAEAAGWKVKRPGRVGSLDLCPRHAASSTEEDDRG